MKSITTLQGKTQTLLDQARRLHPEKDQGFTFVRESFNAAQWARLSAFLAEIEPLYQWYSNGRINFNALSQDQFDQLRLWVCLQHELFEQHSDHAAILWQWLETPWQEDAARLAACDGYDPHLPYNGAFHYQMSLARAGNADRIRASERLEIRQFLYYRERGINYEPCIYKPTDAPGRTPPGPGRALQTR